MSTIVARSLLAAVAPPLVAMLVTAITYQTIDHDSPRFLFFVCAVLVSALYGGLRTGLLTTMLSFLIIGFYFLPTYHSPDVGDWLLIVVFAFIGAGISYIEEERHKSDLKQKSLLAAEQVAYQQVEQALKQVSRLQRVSQMLSAAVSVDDVAKIFVQQAQLVLEAEEGNVHLYHPEASTFDLLYTSSMLSDETTRWQTYPADPTFPITEVVQKRQPLWFSSGEERETRYPSMAAYSRTHPGASFLLPLIVGGQVLGAVGCTFKEGKTFSEAEKALILAISQQCAQALERARLYDAERKAQADILFHSQRLAHLQALTAAFAQARTTQDVSDIIVHQGLDILEAHIGSLGLVLEDRLYWEVLDKKKLPVEIMNDLDYTALNFPGPAQEAVRTRAPVWIRTVEEYYRRFPQAAAATQKQTGTQAIVCLPLILEQRVIGVIGISFDHPHPLNESDQNFLLAIASQCAQTLERIQFYDRAQEASAAFERQRLARDLHDSVSQTLFTTHMLTENVVRTWERSPERALPRLQQVYTLTKAAMAEMRALLLELRPESLEKTPLEELYRQLADTVKGRKDMEVGLNFQIESHPTLLPAVHVAFYRVAQEALNNVIKHSQANQVTISLNLLPSKVELRVIDDGIGFDMAQSSAGIGMNSMRERAEAIGAALQITRLDSGGTELSLIWTATPTT